MRPTSFGAVLDVFKDYEYTILQQIVHLGDFSRLASKDQKYG